MKPKQRLPESNKDRSWKVDNLKYWNTAILESFLKESDLKLLEIASGRMIETDYSYITNPYGLKDKKYQQYPAKLRNFDFISPLFLRWISEYKQRNFEPIVFTRNSNFDNERLEYEKGLIDQSLQQKFVNALVQSGAFDPSQLDETGQPVQEPMSPEVIKQKSSSLPDLKTIQGQHAIDYIVDKQELERKYRKAFEYFIKINKCVTYKYVQWDEVIMQVISPVNVDYYGNRNIEFLEDCETVKVKYKLTYDEVLEIFQDSFEDYKEEYGEDLASILEQENFTGKSNSGGDFYSDYMKNRFGVHVNKDISEDRTIDVTHIQWTSFRKVKQVIDSNGELLNLTEDYQGNDVINEVWYPEEREGYVIANKYYLGGDACEIQRVEADNPFTTKKNYNGRIFLKGDIEQLTPPERLAQYQEAYNVTQFKMQKAINKDMGNVLAMPISLMRGLRETTPMGNIHYKNDIGRDSKAAYEMQVGNNSRDSVIAKNMYFMDASGVLWLDDSSENFNVAVQAIKSINLGQGQWIEWLNNRCLAIKFEAENLLGFNNARTGAINTNESVGNAQQNLVSGSLITEEYFSEFEEFIAKDLQGLLDLSKYAFRVGKKAHYVRSNTDVQVLAIDELFSEASYGIFVRSSAKNKAVKDALELQATQLLQNSPRGGSTVAKIIANSSNYATIIQELEAKEEEMFQTEQQNAQADRENQMQIAQITAESKEKDRELKRYEIDTRQETEVMKAGVMSAGFNIGKEGGEDIATSILAETNKMLVEAQKNNIKVREIQSKEKIATQNNDAKIEVANKQLAVARENKGQ